MEILDALYRSKQPILFEDGSGGTPLWSYRYSYLLFYKSVCYRFNSIKPYEVVGKANHDKLKPIESFDDLMTLNSLSKVLKVSQRVFLKIKDTHLFTFDSIVQVANQSGDIIDNVRFHEVYFSTNKKEVVLKSWDKGDSNYNFVLHFERLLINIKEQIDEDFL